MTKAWRRATIASLQHRAKDGTHTKWAVCNMHCMNGNAHKKRNIPGDARDARRFKQDLLRR